jgi:hypothetical protein
MIFQQIIYTIGKKNMKINNLFSFFFSSRSLQSVHPQYFELVVNLTLLRPK